MHAEKVMTVDEQGHAEVVVTVPERPSGLGWLPDGRLLIVSMRNQQLLRHDPDGLHTVAQQFWASEKVEEPRGIKVGSYCA